MKIEKHYWTIFVEGPTLDLNRFKMDFQGSDVLGESRSTFRETVKTDHAPMTMSSLRGNDHLPLYMFRALSAAWPRLRITLLYRSMSKWHASESYAMYETGRLIRHSGATLGWSRPSVFLLSNSVEIARRYHVHILEDAVFERRLRACGIDPERDQVDLTPFGARPRADDDMDW